MPFITDDRLDEEVLVKKTDGLTGSGTTPLLYEHDTLTYRNLFALALLPSHNGAARILGRAVGHEIQGEDPPLQKFVSGMRSLCEEWNWTGALVYEPTGLNRNNRLSPTMIAELLFRIRKEDNFLYGLIGEYEKQVNVGGPNERIITARHTINPRKFRISPEYVGGKTGTLRTLGGSVAILADTGEQLEAIVVMMAMPIADRWTDTRAILDNSTCRTVPEQQIYDDIRTSMVFENPEAITSNILRQINNGVEEPTLYHDVSRNFKGAEMVDETSRIILSASGNLVQLTINKVRFPPEYEGSNCIPLDFCPLNAVFGLATVYGGKNGVAELSVNKGNFKITNNAQGPVSGSITWLTAGR